MEWIRILYQLLLAISAIHSKRVVHREINPENILIDSDGNVKLIDHGIAKILDYHGDFVTTTAYTRFYGAPEAFVNGMYDKEFDIFSAGVVAYQIFSGFFRSIP